MSAICASPSISIRQRSRDYDTELAGGGQFVAICNFVTNFGKTDRDFRFLRLTAPVQSALRGMAALTVLGAAGQYHLAARAAVVARLPADSLAKVFQRLARRGLLTSRRGPGGGYALSRPAKLISLAQIASAADDGMPVEQCCALGGRLCRPGGCAIHADVHRADSILFDSLTALTLEDLVKHEENTIGGGR